MTSASAGLVIPCYNEAARLDPERVRQAAQVFQVVLVDDGSTDATLAALRGLAGTTVHVVALPHNQGKGEAVRAGLRYAVTELGAAVVGYTDADFATPLSELQRLHARLVTAPTCDGVFGLRLVRMGADIDRRYARHVVGRVFATLAAWASATPMYDSQCGAKWLRVTPALRHALEAPFTSRWAFDVELVARLRAQGVGIRPTDARYLWEEPLWAWHDQGASKVTLRGGARAFADVLALGLRQRRR